ncbi:ORC-CDC6 family AAA ATPase [Sideroxyarcus sp. TK5]
MAGWTGRAETLIGKSNELSDDTKLALYIRHEGSKQGRHYYYFGMDHLARLWSGDIATILQIVKEMFVLGQITNTSTETIPRNIQHQAIVSVSRAFKERVSGYHPFGPEMASLLNNLGTMARDVLVSGLLDSSNIPRRLYRLEMTKDRPDSLLTMLNARNQSASNLARELLRRAVFIQLADSRGKEGHGSQTVRWELRKVYLPAFGTSLERSSYIHVKTLDDFILLLTNSAGFCTNIQAKYSLGKKQDRATGSLFDDEGQQ